MVVHLVGAPPTVNPGSATGEPLLASWTCSVVNNMPDAAFRDTEQQFLELLDAGSGEDVVEVRRHTLNGVPRGSAISSYIDEWYTPLSEIKKFPPDILIVTGSNPIEVEIEAEPYWLELRDLLEWGSKNIASMLLSCLAAHAAIQIFEDIARIHLEEKCTGLFPQSVDGASPLVARIGDGVLFPHSRTNTIHSESLIAHDYQIVIGSAAVGWTVATKSIQSCEVVLMQGHPEYGPGSLLREYRRDARRYVAQERPARPTLPYHCVGGDDWVSLQRLHAALSPSPEGVALCDDYPFEAVAERASWPWREAAQQLYANWLSSVRFRKGHTHA